MLWMLAALNVLPPRVMPVLPRYAACSTSINAIKMSELPHSREWIPPSRYTPGRFAPVPLAIFSAWQVRFSQVLLGGVMSWENAALGGFAATPSADSTSVTFRYGMPASWLSWSRSGCPGQPPVDVGGQPRRHPRGARPDNRPASAAE